MDSLREKLVKLRLKAVAQNLEQVLEDANRKNLSTLTVLHRLADLELECRRQAAVKLRFTQSRLPGGLTIDQFDFNHHKSRKEQKERILSLMDLEFVRESMDVILIGNPGTGKTFIAQTIGFAACNANLRVLFTSAMDMINHLAAAEADHSLLRKLHHYRSSDLLIVDELGYLALGQQGSNLFFQIISARHQKKSTIVTTNLPFADWGKVFDSTTVATAIADRLVYRSEVLILEGKSYRRKEK
jgi:DNA replication protein DnaC